MRKKKKTPVRCDPACCDSCLYIGEGDFICDDHTEEPDKVLVISDWTPTENFLQCRRKNK